MQREEIRGAILRLSPEIEPAAVDSWLDVCEGAGLFVLPAGALREIEVNPYDQGSPEFHLYDAVARLNLRVSVLITDLAPIVGMFQEMNGAGTESLLALAGKMLGGAPPK